MLDLTGFNKDLILEPGEKDDEVPEAPGEPKSVLGDLYELGKHRVLCGDSVMIDSLEKLMDGVKANMVFTDPPYLMGFEGNVHGDGSKSHNAKFGAIKNDKMSVEDGKTFIGDITRNIKAYSSGAYYICFYRLGLHYVFNALHDNAMDYKAVIIWDKGNHTLSNSDYMSKYDPIVYGWTDEHKFYGGRSNFDIWEVPRTSKNELHPTMKPIALCEKAIVNSSEHNGVVLDLFLGSGSTLIASEKTGRICYGMELDPKYVDVIVQRYVDYTGNENIKLNGKEITWQKSKTK
jgi:DNA modification methylase